MRLLIIAATLLTFSVALWAHRVSNANWVPSSKTTFQNPQPQAPGAQQLFAAPCGVPKFAPYTENFDTSALYFSPHCWAEGIKGTGFASVLVSSFNAKSAPHCLELFNDMADTTMAITPALSGLTNLNKQIIFSASTNDTFNKLYIGTVSSPTDLGSFSPIDTLAFSAVDTYQDMRIKLDASSAYNGTHQYIAFLHSNDNSFASIFIDNFEYVENTGCDRPLNLSISAITDSSALVSSLAAGSVLNYSWGPVGFNQASTSTSGGNPFTITSLLPSTVYEVYVQLDCSGAGNDSSAWSGPITFKTDCAAFTAPYSNNFDTDTLYAPPACWKNLLPGPGFKQAEVYTRANSFFSAPNHLRITYPGNFDPADRSIMITPAFADLSSGSSQVRFLADAINGDVPLLVGTMSDPTDPSTFHKVDSIYLVSTSNNMNVANYTEYTVEITTANGYNGTDSYVAFQASPNHPNYSTIYLDNFTYEAIPPCAPPALTSLSVSGISNTAATATWQGGAGLKTTVFWGAPGFTPGTGASVGQSTTTQSTVVMSGLSQNTAYEYYLQDSCAAGKSYFVGPIAFITSCAPAATPYYENFDGPSWTPGTGFSNTGDQLDNCWSRTPQPGNRYIWGIRSGASTGSNTGPDQDFSGSGNYAFTLGNYGNFGDHAFLYTPILDISTLSAPYLSFYVHRFGTTVGELSVEIDTGNGQWYEILNLNNLSTAGSASPFSEAGIDLVTNSNLVQLRFKAVGKACCEGDMAIDEISVAEAPACPNVANISFSSLQDTTITIQWGANGSAGNYEVWHGPQGFYQGSNTLPTQGTITSTTQTSLVIDTLQPNLCYQYLVRSLCGTQDTSTWQGPYTFCTLCNASPTPYYNDFEAGTPASVPDCWTELLSNAGSATLSNANPYAGSQHLELYNDFYPSDILAISPMLDGLSTGTKQVRFQGKSSQASNEILIVGTAANNHDVSSFHPLDTFVLNTNYQTYTVALTTANGFNGTDVFVAFKHGVQTSFERLYIDDLYVEDIPTCPAPAGFTLWNSTDSTATVKWDTLTGTQYEVQYNLGSFTPGQGLGATVNADSASFNLVPGNVPNYVFLRALCGPNDSSYWVGPIIISSPPVPCDNMEAYALGRLQGQSTLFYSNAFFDESEITSARASSGNQSIRFHTLGVNNIASANVDLDIDSSAVYQIAFDINVNTGDRGLLFGIASQGSGPFPNPVSAFQMEFLGTGAVEVTDGNSFSPTLFGSFNFQHNTWEQIHILIDLKNDTAWVQLNGQSTSVGWNYSMQGNIDKTFETLTFAAFNVPTGMETYDFYIDDFCFTEADFSCPPPGNIQLSSLSCDSLEVSWNSNTGGSIIEYGPQGFTPGTGTYSAITTSPHRLGNLLPNTAYDVYVSDTCGADTSIFEGPHTQTTDDGPLPAILLTHTLGYTAGDATLNVNATGSTGDNFLWIFDGTDSANGMQTTQVFTTNGSYTVRLEVSNACGTTDTTFTIQIGIGLEEHALNNGLAFYPNPTQNTLYIKALTGSSSTLNLSVWNLSGQMLMQETNQTFDENSEIALDISTLSTGIYLLRVDSPDQPTQTITLQKQ
jgi:hypothetical protein